MKNTYIVILVIISFLVVLTSCVPVANNAASNSNASNSRRERADNRETTASNNSRNYNRNNNGQVRREDNRQRNNAENVSTISRPNENGKNRTSKSSANSNPFEKRRNALKNVTDEKERFAVDTTYYLLTMEDGITKSTNNVDLSAGYANHREYQENLIKSFGIAIAEFEKSTLFDCSTFNIFSNQFSFNDSLHQEAIFYYAECCISNNNLEEASFVLETLSKEKMNRGVAPKIIVRLGQLYCISGDVRQADKHFKRLKKEYPRSIYNQIANCSRL